MMTIQIPRIELGNVVPGAIALSPDEKGVNETFLGHIDAPSGRHKAYIKVTFGKQLINELIATTIGRALNLPIPPGYLLKVRPIDLPESNMLQQHGKEALIFGSRALDHPTLARRFTRNPSEAETWLRANFKKWDESLIFDDWIANADRHLGNLLVGATDQVWLIDHSHCFTGPDWQANQLQAAQSFGNHLADIFIPSLTLPQRMALKTKVVEIAHLFSFVDISQITNGSFVDRLLSSSDLEAISIFLHNRIPYVINFVLDRAGIPNLGGQT